MQWENELEVGKAGGRDLSGWAERGPWDSVVPWTRSHWGRWQICKIISPSNIKTNNEVKYFHGVVKNFSGLWWRSFQSFTYKSNIMSRRTSLKTVFCNFYSSCHVTLAKYVNLTCSQSIETYPSCSATKSCRYWSSQYYHHCHVLRLSEPVGELTCCYPTSPCCLFPHLPSSG